MPVKGPKIPDDMPIPDGAKRCGNGARAKVKTVRDFGKNRSEPDGLQRYCKACRRATDGAYRRTEKYRAATRARAGRPGRKAKKAEYWRSPAGLGAQKRYRESEVGKLVACLCRARFVAQHDPRGSARALAAARAKLYEGCVAALDEEDGGPVPEGCRRCPQCYTPKPLYGGFYRDVREPSGYSSLCRDCQPGGMPGRVYANTHANATSKRQRILNTLRAARRRLEKSGKPHNRARIEKTIRVCEQELKRA